MSSFLYLESRVIESRNRSESENESVRYLASNPDDLATGASTCGQLYQIARPYAFTLLAACSHVTIALLPLAEDEDVDEEVVTEGRSQVLPVHSAETQLCC